MFAEVVRKRCRAGNFSLYAAICINFLEAYVDLAQDADGGRPRGLSTFGVLQGNFQVQVLALALDIFDAGERLRRKGHHRDARRAGESLLGTRNHHVGAEGLHVEGVGEEGADAVHDQEQVVPLAEIADELHVVVNAGGGLVLVHDKGGVALAFEFIQVLGLERLARLELDFGEGNLVQFAEFHETVPEATAVDDNRLVGGGEGVHDGGFHARRTRTCNEDDPGVVGGLCEFLDQSFVLEHQFREFRRAEIGNLLCADGSYDVTGLYRAYCKVDHNMYSLKSFSSIFILSYFTNNVRSVI